jgi:hypothetical protein
MKQFFLFAVGVCVLAGCATPYKGNGIAGGFSETQLSENVWRVNFQGNGYTRGERATDMALMRSADLALMNGFTHFAIADSKSDTQTAAFTTPMTATTTGSASRIGNNVYGSATTRFSGGDTIYISYPSANNTVVMFKGKPENIPMAFDALFLCQSLGKKYESSCEALRPAKK